MTLPAKGSRKITVAHHTLRWRYIRRDTGQQALLVVQGTGKGQLIVHGPLSPEPGRVLTSTEIVTPSVVETWCQTAFERGWDPNTDNDMVFDPQNWPHWRP